MQNKKKQKNLPVVNIQEHLKSGVYSNIAKINISKREVLIDFIFRGPDEANVVSRVIMPIPHAQALLMALSNLLKRKK